MARHFCVRCCTINVQVQKWRNMNNYCHSTTFSTALYTSESYLTRYTMKDIFHRVSTACHCRIVFSVKNVFIYTHTAIWKSYRVCYRVCFGGKCIFVRFIFNSSTLQRWHTLGVQHSLMGDTNYTRQRVFADILAAHIV